MDSFKLENMMAYKNKFSSYRCRLKYDPCYRNLSLPYLCLTNSHGGLITVNAPRSPQF